MVEACNPVRALHCWATVSGGGIVRYKGVGVSVLFELTGTVTAKRM